MRSQQEISTDLHKAILAESRANKRIDVDGIDAWVSAFSTRHKLLAELTTWRDEEVRNKLHQLHLLYCDWVEEDISDKEAYNRMGEIFNHTVY